MAHISWDQYFMGVALLSSKRSKDPSTQVGACIVNEDKRIIGIGYNGFPTGLSDDEFPWGKHDANPLNNKYPYVVHAEPNAILNSTSNLKGSTLYVTLFPCNECTKLIIQSGIKHIIYLNNKYKDTDSIIASRRMLDAAGIDYKQMGKLNLFIE
jgi:dCMP deaminase